MFWCTISEPRRPRVLATSFAKHLFMGQPTGVLPAETSRPAVVTSHVERGRITILEHQECRGQIS